jgi:hypothetical protein
MIHTMPVKNCIACQEDSKKIPRKFSAKITEKAAARQVELEQRWSDFRNSPSPARKRGQHRPPARREEREEG